MRRICEGFRPLSHVHTYASPLFVRLITLRIDLHMTAALATHEMSRTRLVPVDVVGARNIPLPDPASAVLTQQRRGLVQVDPEDALDVARQLITLVGVSRGTSFGREIHTCVLSQLPAMSALRLPPRVPLA